MKISAARPAPRALEQRRALGPPLHFVTFHVDVGEHQGGAHPHTDLAQHQYLAMIAMLFASARRFHPGSRCTVLTTPQTDLQLLGGNVARFDGDVDIETLMRDRMACQLRLVDADAFDLPIVLLDSDILVNAALTEVFAQDFDVGLTWRDVEQMPFNGGVIFLNNRDKQAAKTFLSAVYQVYLQRHRHRAKWFGDQTAMYDYLDVSVEDISRSPVLEKDGCRYAFFPCDTYNFSPEDHAGEILTPLDDKAILHFKGARKRLMPYYFDANLRFGGQPSLLGPFRQWRARNALRRLAAGEGPVDSKVERK